MSSSADKPRSKANAMDVRPIVARERGQLPAWLAIGVIILGGVLLFIVLDGQRRTATAPTTQARTVDSVGSLSALPPLLFPEPPPPPPLPLEPAEVVAPPALAPPPPPPPQYVPQPPPPSYAPAPAYLAPQPAPSSPIASSGAALVVDTTGAAETSAGGTANPTVASRLSRPSTTVPQGTLIPAVLETALDSTRPGHVRAIVSRDVRGFDGRQVLIPRGTRVFGEYQADMSAGQDRALVQWTRLVRPDGVTIAIASPAADLEGRAGIEGRVDSHFLERFGGALLRSVLSIGSGLAGQKIGGDGSVIVLPGGVQGAEPLTADSGPRPTLRVDAGARVTVFVARDLEFPPGESAR